MSIIAANQVIVCTGETGSGKTTQIPQYLREELIGDDRGGGAGLIGVTQPRRVAAMSVAKRVAEERGVRLGGEVGYSIRFEDRTSAATVIKYMTDGMLIREVMADPLLPRYAAIMLDEAHERSIHTDVLFGLLKQALAKRPALKAVISSATLDVSRFAAYFNNCPVVTVPGRAFPVDIYHSKTKQIMTVSGPASYRYVEDSVKTALKIHTTQGPGHVLLFLTGQEEIEEATRQLSAAPELSAANGSADGSAQPHVKMKMRVVPLYGALTADAQSEAFAPVPGNVRKVIVATNIAETSVTVPGVRFVVDAGYVKQKVYDPQRRMESLVVVPISQAAAAQRAGRAGRTHAGQCYRLYSRDCLSAMAPEMVPEIRRTNLANTVLYLKVVGVRDVLAFDYLDPPDENQLVEALQLLHCLGAIDADGAVTPMGTQTSRFPLEPCLSRALVASTQLDCTDEMLTVVAMLSVETIWYKRPRSTQRGEADEAAQAAHARLRQPHGDCPTYLHVFRQWERAGCSDQWARSNFVRIRALRMARSVRSQLQAEVQRLGNAGSGGGGGGRGGRGGSGGGGSGGGGGRSHGNAVDRMRQALCAGFFMNAAQQASRHGVYSALSMPGLEVPKLLHLHPSCGDISAPHTHVVFVDLVSTARPTMRHVTAVDSAWLDDCRTGVAATTVDRLCGRKPPAPLPEVVEAAAAAAEQRLRDSSAAAAAAAGDRSSAVEAARQRALARKKQKG